MEERTATVVLLNPTAGKGRARAAFPRIREYLGEHHRDAELFLTEAEGDATRLLAELPLPPGSRVVAVGGDGTVHEVALALFEREDVALGVVPMGSGNDVAAQLGAPRDPLAALELALTGAPRAWDMGVVGPHSFLNTVGFALSAETCHWSQRTGRLTGLARYGTAVARAWWHHRPLRLHVDGLREPGEHEVNLMEIGIGDRSGGGFRLTRDAVVDDGLLDVCLVRGLPRWKIPLLAPRALVGRHTGHPSVLYEQATSLRLTLETDTRIHVDGEVRQLARGQHSVRVRPKALRLVAAPTGGRTTS